MRIRRRIAGLILLAFGLGMIIGLVATGWAFVIAAIVMALGFGLLFL